MKRLLFATLLLVSFGYYACDNEIDLTANYKDITVVYGLLDPKQDTQWLKINKAFLGDGDALVFAQIPDSLYYDSLKVYMVGYTSSNTVGDSVVFERTVGAVVKDTGIFATDDHELYRAVTPTALNTALTYKLTIIKPGYQDTVRSQTILCKNFVMAYPPLPTTLISFESPTGLDPNPGFDVRWTHDQNTYAYQLGMRFKYWEWIASDTANKTYKQFTYFFPSFTVYFSNGGYNTAYYNLSNNQVKYPITKENFYAAILTFIPKDPPGTPSGQLRVRQFNQLDFVVLQASKELYMYITLNQPTLSFVQRVSDYTNISPGVGVFASRSRGGIDGLNLNQQTRDSLRLGQYTLDLHFVP